MGETIQLVWEGGAPRRDVIPGRDAAGHIMCACVLRLHTAMEDQRVCMGRMRHARQRGSMAFFRVHALRMVSNTGVIRGVYAHVNGSRFHMY